MKTKNVSWRCAEEEYEALRMRAKRLKLGTADRDGVSKLVTNVMRFFGKVEQISPFWDNLIYEATRRKKDPAMFLAELLEAQKKEEHRFVDPEEAI